MTVDPRSPKRYLGEWKRSIPYIDHKFAQDDLDEPHAKRRLEILKEHPNITRFYGKNPYTFVILLSAIIVHLATTFALCASEQSRTVPIWMFVTVAFIVGGTINQLMGVLIHESTHNLVFPSLLANKATLLMSNIPLPFPIAASFRRYHLEHHAYQAALNHFQHVGVAGKDPDLPLEIEHKLIKGNRILKTLWLLIYPLMYVLRGASMKKTPSTFEVVNLFTVLVTQLVIYRYFGGTKALSYNALSFWFGYSIHPGAAHFIQEHFTWKDGQETYSYYGPLNFIFLNIGYHNEHHDFTQVPWNNLPKIKAVAREYYDCWASHSSWVGVFWEFIFDPTLGPQSRLERSHESHITGRKMITDTLQAR